MRRIELLDNRAKESKMKKILAMEYARLNKELLGESKKFKRLVDIKLKLEL